MTDSIFPSEWHITTLGKIANWGSGGTPSRKHPEYYNGNVPWVKTGDLGPKVLSAASEHITDLGVQQSSAKYFPKGSVAIAMYGATIGKASILGFEATTNQACGVGRPIAGVTSSLFLYYLLKNEKDAFIAKGKGGAQPNISQTLIKEHSIALPPFAEQKIIADKLDTLLAQVDNTKARLERIPEILKRFRQSVLAAAVSGRLTEAWRSQNSFTSPMETWPSSKEIVRPFKIPNDWIGVSLGSVSERVSVGHVGKTSEFYTDATIGIPFLRSQNIRPGRVSLDGLAFITETFHTSLKKSRLQAGDLLIVRVGANRGNACVLPDLFDQVNCANIVFARPKTRLSPYLNLYFQSPIPQELLLGASVGGAQGVINTKSVAQTFLALPPVEEQTEIVRRVDQLFAYADTIERQVNNALARVNQLTQSILAKAFRGELTEQWRKDNPELISGENSAEALLERIKAERAAKAPAKRTRKKATT